ncbi:MAG: universal stress protein [Steroidobacteraceae bacterium]|jgi:universal stress protein E|nr:universal stress protein [Steroidobacteraceae bacterium]
MARLPDVRTVLLALADPADHRQPVIERAAQVSAALGARIVLFHAAFDPFLTTGPLGGSKRMAQARGRHVAGQIESLEKLAASLRRRGLTVDVLVVWEEPAHEAIIRAAIREKAQLIVAGPHQKRGDRYTTLRLTDWELLRMSAAPLLLVRSADGAKTSGAVLAALDPTHAKDKPAALDTALALHGARMADALGVEFHVVHSVPLAAYAFDETTPAARRAVRDERRRQLHALLQKAGVSAHKIHVPEGEIETTASRLATQLPAQLLVLGAISRRGLKRFAVGNTAERIIHEAPCDLLIIKPDGFRPRLGRVRKHEVILPATTGIVSRSDVS